jgi:hypothetical protein
VRRADGVKQAGLRLDVTNQVLDVVLRECRWPQAAAWRRQGSARALAGVPGPAVPAAGEAMVR